MVSTFNFRAYLSIFVMMVIFTVLIIIGFAMLIDAYIADVIIFMVFIIFLILLIVYEFRNKIISVTVAQNHIRKSSYFAKDKIYDFKYFDGFRTRVSKGRFKNYEFLYLIKNGTRIITLSQVNHKNYDELKALIAEKSKNLGAVNYDLLDEITEIVTFDL